MAAIANVTLDALALLASDFRPHPRPQSGLISCRLFNPNDKLNNFPSFFVFVKQYHLYHCVIK